MIANVVKGLHIIAVIAWMAGLLYMPRLFVYHTRASPGSEMDETFKVMERKLETVIMTPAMIAVMVLGLSMVAFVDGAGVLARPWMMVKLLGVACLAAWHVYLCRARRLFAAGRQTRGERFWRLTNELPMLAAIVVVLSVTTKFGG
jgi:putative membrane protein